MWDFIKQNPFLVGAATGSLAASLLGLFVSWLKREKKWLGFSVTSRNVVSKGHGRLSISFDQRGIERLDSHTITLRNIGNKALKDLPIAIRCDHDGEIVEVQVVPPEGEYHFEDKQYDRNWIEVFCTLLNPGEAFSVGLTVADAKSEGIIVTARAENLLVKSISPSASLDEILEAFATPGGSLTAFFLASLAKLGGRKR